MIEKADIHVRHCVSSLRFISYISYLMKNNMVTEICILCPAYPNFHQSRRYPSKSHSLCMTRVGIPGKVVQNRSIGHKST